MLRLRMLTANVCGALNIKVSEYNRRVEMYRGVQGTGTALCVILTIPHGHAGNEHHNFQ